MLLRMFEGVVLRARSDSRTRPYFQKREAFGNHVPDMNSMELKSQQI